MAVVKVVSLPVLLRLDGHSQGTPPFGGICAHAIHSPIGNDCAHVRMSYRAAPRSPAAQPLSTERLLRWHSASQRHIRRLFADLRRPQTCARPGSAYAPLGRRSSRRRWPMKNATFFGACGVPDTMHITVKVAVRLGRVVGVSAYRLGPPELAGVVERVVRCLPCSGSDGSGSRPKRLSSIGVKRE